MDFKTLSICGFDPALKGMRLPLKSHHKADSYYDENDVFVIGPNDYNLMKRLWKGGTEHRKWMRQVIVWADITAPRYWWSEFDTYKVGTSANSESTMHTLLKEKLGPSEFEWPNFENDDYDIEIEFQNYLNLLRMIRDQANNAAGLDKERLQQILKGMLPESFLQKRMVCLNYEVLATMYRQRKSHRLPQWREVFTNWIETLPYSEFITGAWPDE